MWDGYPVAVGHALVIPRRHFASWFSATSAEHSSLLTGIEVARRQIQNLYSPDGFNIGINEGEASGQTIDHLHVHVIPRYRGDVRDPRGGVRHVIPGMGNYTIGRKDAEEAVEPYFERTPKSSILGNDTSPLLAALVDDLAESSRFDLAVAFITESGLRQIEPHLIDFLSRGGRMRLLTGDYLDVTEPRALQRLLDWVQEYSPNVDARVFQADSHTGFHPKAYLLHRDYSGAVAYVGSSNLTRHALKGGVEWNQRLEGGLDRAPIADIYQEFERLFKHRNTTALTVAWITAYAKRRQSSAAKVSAGGVDSDSEQDAEVFTPHEIQSEALKALRESRLSGNEAGLVVMATGLGKTWLAAFDSVNFERVLFVAHREEILNQALDTFRRIRPDSRLGLYGGGKHDKNADVLFASIQTLGRKNHLEQFDAARFDYIVIDEFHHAAASTYRRLIDYFEPDFLLGLTATPERTDGGDLLALCAENLVFRCDLFAGIEQGLLSPFAYFGVPDEVDFANIPWRSGRFEPEALEFAVATEKRAQNAFDQWRKRAQSRTLAFCVSKRHADLMAGFFRARGVKSVAVHSGPGTAPRTRSLEELERGELQVVFAVDMFNEGVDVPAIDTVMMLRPTESKILWLQQFGRGLRRAENKERLVVVDYIGNHRTFLQVPALLLPCAGSRVGEVSRALAALEGGELTLPAGCSIQYELQALEILKQLARPTALGDQIVHWYRSFRELHDRRPTASEAYHVGYDPKGLRSSFGSWFSFVDAEGDLSPDEQHAYRAYREFIDSLEITPMTKSFKMITLLAMIGNRSFPGAIDITTLAAEIKKIVGRNKILHTEYAEPLGDTAQLQRVLESNPIDAWVGGRGTAGKKYFSYENGSFESFPVEAQFANALRNLAREQCDYRLASYLIRLQNRRPQQAVDSEALISASPDQADLWHEYLREDIPLLWNFRFNPGSWNQGFVQENGHIFLLVSLDKQGLREEHQYEDEFLSIDVFQWVSQNRTKQQSRAGKAIANHQSNGTAVHLFVRGKRKTPTGSGAPFIYCGEVIFLEWQGEEPIVVRWRLKHALPKSLQDRFAVPRSG